MQTVDCRPGKATSIISAVLWFVCTLLLLAVSTVQGADDATLCLVSVDPTQVLYMLQAIHKIKDVDSALSPAQIKFVVVKLETPIDNFKVAQTLNDNGCSLVIGPGMKDFSLSSLYELELPGSVSAASPVPIIDYSSVAGELSDKQEHKLYTRMVVADASTLVSSISTKFGWENIAVVIMGGGEALKFPPTSKIRIVRNLVLRDDYLGQLDSFFQEIQDDFTFVPIFVIAPDSWRKGVTLAGLHQRYKTHEHKSLIFVQYTDDCVPSPAGSFCAHFEPLTRSKDVLSTVYDEIDSGTIHPTVLSQFGKVFQDFPPELARHSPTEFTDFYRAMIIDAVHVAGHLFTTHDVNSLQVGAVRGVRIVDGVSGTVEFSGDGERVSGQVAVKNWHKLSQTPARAATYEQNKTNVTVSIESSLYIDANGKEIEHPLIMWPGDRLGGAFPTAGKSKATISTEALLLFASCTIVSGILFIWALTRIIHRFMEAKVVMQENRLQSMTNGYFMFIAITHYRAMRRKFPLKSGPLVEQFVIIAESLANKHTVCIVKFVEDHLMLVAAQHPLPILHFAIDLQSDLNSFDWLKMCPNLNSFYERQEEQARTGTHAGPAATKKSSSTTLFNGLRVRMGISCGPFHEGRDASGKVDYLGDSVNVAARVSSAAAGGQILCSARVLSGIAPVVLAQFAGAVENLGHFQLSGLRFPVEIYQLMAKDLHERQFVTLGDQNDAKIVVMEANAQERIEDYFRDDSIVSAVFE